MYVTYVAIRAKPGPSGYHRAMPALGDSRNAKTHDIYTVLGLTKVLYTCSE